MVQEGASEGDFLADKLMDLGNLSVVVMVFGQFVTAKIIWPVLAFGIMWYITLLLVSRALRKR
jgi:hypothetical protein